MNEFAQVPLAESRTNNPHTRTSTTLLALLLTVSGCIQPADPIFNGESGEPVEMNATLTVLYVDDFDKGRSDLQFIVEDKQSNKKFKLKFKDTPPGHLRSGMEVQIRGRAKGKEITLAADDVNASNETSAPSAPTFSGEQKTLVVVADFTDASVFCSVDDIRDLMFTSATDESIDDLYQETSFGAIWLSGQVVGRYTIDFTNDDCDLDAWGTAADAAALADGVDVSSYNRKIYVTPKGTCGGSGVGTVGGNPSRSWIFSCHLPDVYAHELGHNFALHHAATPSSPYGDRSDIMGYGGGPLRQVNAPHKEQLGWLGNLSVGTIEQTGFYDIAPLELDAASAIAPQALRIYKADTDEYYYLSYRRGIGFDANLSSSLYLDRLSVHSYAGDGSSSMTYLLALAADGESFVDSLNGISVTTMSHDEDFLTVEVTLDSPLPPPTCAAAAPLVVLSPASQTATAGNSVDFTVSVTNQDGAACSTSSFALTSAVPMGWNGTISPASLSLGPSETGNATFSVASSAAATAGSYNVSVTATDNTEVSHTATGNGTYAIDNPGSAGDVEPPETPTGLDAAANRRRVNLSWSASNDNVGVAGYRVYRDGALIGTTSELSYADRDGASGVTYEYRVAAYDAAGNASAMSAAVIAAKGQGGGKGKRRK